MFHVLNQAKNGKRTSTTIMRITEDEKLEAIEMWKSGKYYNTEIAEWLGISITSVGKIIKEYQNGNKTKINKL